MDLTHLDINTVFTVGGFVAAVVWQSAMLKTKVNEIHNRMTKIEGDVHEVSALLIANEAQKVTLQNIERRLSTIEGRCFSAPPEH